jgi:hypothetical protein
MFLSPKVVLCFFCLAQNGQAKDLLQYQGGLLGPEQKSYLLLLLFLPLAILVHSAKNRIIKGGAPNRGQNVAGLLSPRAQNINICWTLVIYIRYSDCRWKL